MARHMRGRTMITTDEVVIDESNILDVLRRSHALHVKNANDIEYLINYEKGDQPLQRKKTYRPDIDCQCSDNVANEVTEFNTGFKWGNAITLVQTGDGSDEEISEAVSELNKQYAMARIKAKTQELGRYVEICGICNVYVDINMDWRKGKPLFELDVLDPRSSFVVRSSYYPDKRIMLGVTYRHDSISGNTYYTCYTKDQRFEVVNLQSEVTSPSKWAHMERSGEENPLHIVPITEYIRSYDRMGAWERYIDEMDNLNLLISDFTNDVEQNTQAMWHTNDVDFPVIETETESGEKVEEVRKPKSGEWLQTYTNPDGKTPFVKPLAIDYDYPGMLENIQYRRAIILQKCNVPARNDNTSGATGVAMSDATGWSHAESAAAKQQLITDSNKLDEVEIVLSAIRENPNTPQDSPLRDLTTADVKPSIKRQKTYELSTKCNSIATLINTGVNGKDVFNTIPLFDDPNEVWENSKETIEKNQNQNAESKEQYDPKNDRIMSDLSDQVENSPLIDKSRTEK